jgi:Ca-activated chloride channel family protein
MSAIYAHLVLIPIGVFLIFLILSMRAEMGLYSYVKMYWYHKVRAKAHLSRLFYYISIFVFLLASLDFRGEEQKIKGKVGEKKTLILIDTSMSMLVEDVKPNRFEKAILLARHFAKNSPGHTIGVILFSDTHKKLVPFTKDIELLDSRIAGLKDLKIRTGGTNLTTVIQESLNYIGVGKKDQKGNILVLTDAEENEARINLKIPETISLAVVGVGTTQGGKIPLRDSRGVLMGYKKYEGEDVISKLSDKNLEQLGSGVSSFKYWLASTYSLPTREVLNFFDNSRIDGKKSGDIIVKPVVNHFIIIFAIILYCFSVLLKFGKNFSPIKMIIFFCVLGVGNYNDSSLMAQEKKEKLTEEQKKEKRAIEEKIDQYLNKWRERELIQGEKLDLAGQFLKLDKAEQANQLYHEELAEIDIKENNQDHFFNYAVSALKLKKNTQALEVYRKLLQKLKEEPEKNQKTIEKIRENIKKILEEQKGKSQDQNQKDQDDKKKEQKKDQKDQKQSSDKKQDQDQKQDQQDKQKNQKDSQKNNKNEQNQEQDQKDKNEKEKDKGDQKEDQKQEQDKQKQDQNKKPSEQKGQKKELPAILKQLISDDRKLQKELIDTSTSEKRKKRDKKEW